MAEWARRREERLAKRQGQRRAVPLTTNPHRGSHIDPDAPRAIMEYDGLKWVPLKIVPNRAEAQALLSAATNAVAFSRVGSARTRTRSRPASTHVLTPPSGSGE
ncbi:DUF6087 family protein [Streptomyces sp. NPDC048350]|uniref:DUF6087 family protein n=1 Tax=Streptomyces sp. NPDC048350 TaxID=3365538 RepID=UPI00371EAF1F